jgi:hypothetical protein
MPILLDDLDALRTVIQTLEPFGEADRTRILRWAWEKLVAQSATPPGRSDDEVLESRAALDAPQPVPIPIPEVEPVWSTRRTDRPPDDEEEAVTGRPDSPRGHTDVAKFLRAARPANERELAAAVAYYFRFVAAAASRKDHVTKEDLLWACRTAKRPRPARPGRALIDAEAKGLVERAGRGHYRLTLQGESEIAAGVLTARGATEPTPEKPKAGVSSRKKRVNGRAPTPPPKRLRAPHRKHRS